MNSATSTDSYAVDGLTPDRVVSPASVEELSALLAETHAAGEAVIPFGGGTRMHIGNVPERYTTALDMTVLSKAVTHEAGDLTLVADAGVRIANLEKTLASNGQRLPFDVRFPERATLGGSVASNAGGQMRSSFGGIRDWIIGMKVVLADGTVTKSGGKVVKNVQGYDLHRLHTGAFGTLGVIAEVALKVVPVPEQTSTVAAWFEAVGDAGEYAMQVVNGPAMPEAFTVFTGVAAQQIMAHLGSPAGGAQAVVLATVTGGEKAVTRMQNDLTGIAGTTGAVGYEVAGIGGSEKLWGAALSADEDFGLTVGATFKPRDAISFLAAAVEQLSGTEGRHRGELQAGFGSVSFSLEKGTLEDVERVTGLVSEYGGRAVTERCPVEIKREIDVFGEQSTELSIMRSIKQRFDPNRILNPGRFAGRI